MQDKVRHINFNKFIEDRSVEIAKFLVDLELDTKKKGHQALPKSIRRRAMSHNRFRIPKRLRRTMEEELAKAESMQKLPRCRKHIRKRRHLITAYKMRIDKVQWLSTHLWASRRMRMVNYYGYKVALSPNNKSFRSAYRFSKHSCTLSDLSFYHTITLTATQSVQNLPPLIQFTGESLPVLGKLYPATITSKDSEVCPCWFLRSPGQFLTLRIFFHPAAVQQIKGIGVPQGWKASMQQGQTDIYCLNGPQSLSIIQQALKQYGMLQETESIFQKFYGRQSPAVYFSLPNNNYMLSNKPLIDSPIPEEKLVAQEYAASSNSRIRAKMLSIFASLSENENNHQGDECQDTFWKMFDLGQNHQVDKISFRITLRSKYTHRRKNKLTKEEKRQVIREERESSEEGKSKRKREQSSGDEHSRQERQIFIQQPFKTKQTVLEPVHPVLIASTRESYLVFAHNANNCRLWRILSKLNVKVIGRKQLNHYNLENGIRTFPEDYPETQAFRAHRKIQIADNFQKYIRLPLPKRPNYLQLNSPYPFAPFIPSKPIPVELQIVSSGHCQALSYICELNSADLVKISNKLDSGHLNIVHSEQGQGQRQRYKEWAEMEKDLQKTSPSRKIIGSVTSGGYRFSRSREGGLGFIDQTLLSACYFDRFGGYLLIRKLNSPHYVLAQLLQHVRTSQKSE